MLAIFGVSYFFSAASFYLLFARSAISTPFPKWIWERSPAQKESAHELDLAA